MNIVSSLFNGHKGTHCLTDVGSSFRDDAKEYRKTATIRAIRIDHPFEVVTMEGTMRGKPGDWLVEGPAGEAWVIDAGIFAATYEEV